MLDVFKNDAFSVISMTDAVNKMPFKPGYLLSSGLFRPVPVRTRTVAIEMKAGRLTLIPTVPAGAPPARQGLIKPTVRDFRVPRLFKQDEIQASELSGVRAFGTEDMVQTLQQELAGRQMRLMDDMTFTWEYHLLGAVQGVLRDADGSTIYDWFAEWGLSVPTAIAFTNAAVTAAGGMRPFLAKNIVRPMLRAAQAGNLPGVRVKGLVGDDFYDWLTNHPDVKETYLNFQGAADLRQGNAFEEFTFGGVTFVNYRGSDDNTTVAIGVNDARFYPEGIPGLFQMALAPMNTFATVNTLGRQFYSRLVTDDKRDEWVQLDVESNPLAICTRPEVLLRGTRS
jgi:hypothetical protein